MICTRCCLQTGSTQRAKTLLERALKLSGSRSAAFANLTCSIQSCSELGRQPDFGQSIRSGLSRCLPPSRTSAASTASNNYNCTSGCIQWMDRGLHMSGLQIRTPKRDRCTPIFVISVYPISRNIFQRVRSKLCRSRLYRYVVIVQIVRD